MSAKSILFDGLDEGTLDHVTDTIGMGLVASAAFSSVGLIRDDRIDPATLIAGTLRAHLFGAASAIGAAINGGAIEIGNMQAVADDIAAFVVDVVLETVVPA